MSLLAVVIIFAFAVNRAKTCKPVNYEYKQFKNEQYGYGCKKGCFGYANTTDGIVDEYGRKADGNHYKQDVCVECETITADFIKTHYIERYGDVPVGATLSINNTELEKACNGFQSAVVVDYQGTLSYPNSGFKPILKTCFWKKEKCVATSCPNIVSIATCNGNWSEGKCKKKESSDCHIKSFSLGTKFPGDLDTSDNLYLSDAESTTTEGCAYQLANNSYNYVELWSTSAINYRWVICDDLDKYFHSQQNNDGDYECVRYTSGHVKECKYQCENPFTSTTTLKYEYTKDSRKKCHQVYGCLYAGADTHTCSSWAVWAYVLALAGGIVGYIVLMIVFYYCLIKRGLFKKLGLEKEESESSPNVESSRHEESAPDGAE